MTRSTASFSQRLLHWFDQHGRHDLPWQQNPTAYRVWISEIMLQQTQVNTVIPYYQRFITRFPEVQTLAVASLDEVLHYWTGLGYYARARHLHQAAQRICTEFQAQLPTDLDDLMQLPGIGRSTAGAILALSSGRCHPILDGNVKRVLCRYHAIEGWPGAAKVAAQLWDLVQQHTPNERIADYTQAIMDLGATICHRRHPHCTLCPFNSDCIAHQYGQETHYPTSKPRKRLPVKTTIFIMLQNQKGEVLLEKRPNKGIWGGLWGFPECATFEEISGWCQQYLNRKLECYTWPSLRHTFTHFHLEITPVHIPFQMETGFTMAENTIWYNTVQPQACGLATPVARLLAQLTSTGE